MEPFSPQLELYEPSGRLGSAVVPKPKDRYELEVGGGENMMVGLVAVDEAVFLLNDKQTLTRELVRGHISYCQPKSCEVDKDGRRMTRGPCGESLDIIFPFCHS